MYNDDKKKANDKNEVMKKPLEIISMRQTETDPSGSYTGVPENSLEKPVQDADDL